MNKYAVRNGGLNVSIIGSKFGTIRRTVACKLKSPLVNRVVVHASHRVPGLRHGLKLYYSLNKYVEVR